MKKALLTLLVLAPFAGQAGAAVVFGGDFQMYKPGTGYAVTANFAPSSFARGVGDGITMAGGTVDYSDGTSGTVADLPGWTGPIAGTNTNDLTNNGIGGTTETTGLNVFGTWSGGNGALIESSAPLARPTLGLGQVYEISVMVNGSGGPLTFDLMVDGTVVTPSSALTPTLPTSDWEKFSRTYDSLPAGDVTILLGIEKLGDDLYGTRTILDDVSFDAVPEPSSTLLLGLGGVALMVRRKRK